MTRIRFLHLFSLLMAVQLAMAQNAMQRYEYWMDNDYQSRTVVATSQDDISFEVDFKHIAPGLHYLNVRGQTASGLWGALSHWMVYLAESGTDGSMKGYEYWMDNDYGNRTVVPSGGVPSAFTFDISKMSPGLHYFNFRARSSSGQWGGLSRYLVYLAESGKGAESMTAYEYWMDNDYEGRVIKNNSTLPDAITIDVSTLSPGVHYFNYRAKSSSGQWGGLTRILVYLAENGKGDEGVTEYEYWLDNDYQNRTSVKSAIPDNALTIDVTDLKPGIHYFNFRAKATSGQWGGLIRHMAYIFDQTAKSQKVEKLEYWIDEAFEQRVTQQVTSDSTVITVDLSEMELGQHTFNFYGVTTEGERCMLTSLPFSTDPLPLVPAPKVIHVGNTITIADGEGAEHDYPIEYRYTLDGTKPTKTSTLYEGPFAVLRNNTLNVIGFQYAHDPSEMVTLDIDWFRVANPVFAQVGKTLTITTDTTRAAIYYKIGDGEEQLYTASIRLSSQNTVTAVGRYEGYHDSETMTYQPRVVKSAKPVAAYNGRYLQLNSNEEGVSFHYTIDGSSPAQDLDVSGNAIEYRGQMTIDTLCTVRAVAIIDTMNVSDVLEFPIDYLYNDQTETAYLRKAGELEKAFEWCGGTNGVTQLHVEGTLSDKDVAVLKDMTALRHLDMQKVQLTSNQLVNDAFASSPMVSYISPSALTRAGGRLFADCPNLAAVVWNANVSLGSNTFAGVSNPNLLLYVNSAALNQTTATNVVVNGTAEKITLSDATTGNSNFYCPQAFTAQNISYTHEYQQQTVIGKTQGWETLTLPFTVQKMTHATHGALLPFSASGEGYPFWLMGLDGSGLQLAQSIEAYKPYVISMPNNPSVYDDQYNQNGKVTFSAQQAKVEVTQPETATDSRGNTLIPAYQTVARSAAVFALNVGEQRDEYAPGSAFIADYRDVRPFEVYMPQAADSRRAMALQELMGTVPTGIFELKSAEDSDGEISVYSLSGLLISKGRREEVMRQLAKGIYIINGKKMIVK